jgi:transposase
VLTLSPSIRIFLCLAPADMRKSLDGLSAMVRSEMGEEPLSGHLFIFRNRRGDRLKVLSWDRNGFALWYKRLEKGRFSFPRRDSGKLVISESSFQLLVGGLSLERVWSNPKISEQIPTL